MRQAPLKVGLLTTMLVFAWSLSPAIAQELFAPLPIPFTATLGQIR